MPITFASTACPAVVVPGTPVWLTDTTDPPTSDPFTAALGASGVSVSLNKNFKAHDMGFQYGAGGYGVGYGLTLSAGTGLTVVISDGQAVIDGVVEVKSLTAPVVNASTTNWVWLMADGTIAVVDTSTTKPAGNCCLLGAAITSGSAVTSVDFSGVVYWRGGWMWRQTNDLGKPADTPDSSLLYLTKTQTGLWLWDGTAYQRLDPRGRSVVVMASDANLTLAADQYAQGLLDVTSGVSLTATRNLVLPTTVQAYDVRNKTTGAQSLQFKTASGTGITVANGMAARVYCDGTNIVRLSADAST